MTMKARPGGWMESKRAGLKVYHGRPCRHGHGTLRMTDIARCIVCHREKARKYSKTRRLKKAGDI